MNNLKVKKRKGIVVPFDKQKIFEAIRKAAKDVNQKRITNEMNLNDVKTMTNYCVEAISLKHIETIDIELIQDIVEKTLMLHNFCDTAKAYILYRNKHQEQREASERLMNLYDDLLFADSEDMDLKRDNANINTDAPMGIMLKLGTEGAKNYLNHYVLPEKFKEMHMKHIEHLHDADFSLITLNCITGDTEVFFKNYFGNTRKVPFTYFDPFFEKFGDIVDVEHTGMKVLSDNGEYTSIRKLMRRKCSEDLYRFTLNNGLTIDCTGDHQMLLDDYTVIDAKKVKVGQKLKSPKYPKHVDKIKHINIIDALGDTDDYVIYNSDEIRKSIPGDKKYLFYECLTNATKVKYKKILYQKKFTIHEYLSIRGKIDIDESKLLISASNGKNKIPAIIPVNKDLGKIAGYIASEGYICKENSSVIFSNQDKKLLNDYVNCVKSVFPDLKCHVLNDINSTSNCKNIITEGKIFVKLLSGVILNKNKSYDISIPDWYSDATIDFIDGFLSAELDGDGYVNNTNGQIVISTCCEKFAKQIHKLLLELNISSILKSKNTIGETFTLDGVPSERNHNSYSIFCNGKNSDVFRDTIEYSFKCNNTTFKDMSRKATLEWKIASIERIPFNGYVYDFETENHMFVANNILTHNCLYVDLAKVLRDGFNTGHGFIREPKSIRAASSLACVIIQSSQNDCFGGQSLVGFDFALSKYVKMSFKKSFINKFKEFMRFFDYPSDDDFIAELMKEVDFDNILRFNENGSKKYTVIDSGAKCSIANYIMHHLKCPEIKYAETIYDLACEETREETEQAMEALVHNFNSLHSRAGSQVPFSSINTGMDTSQEGRLINKCLLDATWNGLGNGETPIFPITVFLLHKGVNLDPGDPNYDLFEYACKVSARRLFPNFLNIGSSFNEPYYKPDDYRTFASSMGCRTRVLSNINGPEHAASRGNFAFTTINLPYLALEASRKCKNNSDKEVVDEFFKLFDKYIMLGKEYLEWRFEIIARKKVYNYPFVFGQKLYMGSENLKPDDEIREALKNASLSIGFVGLAECLKALIGKHQGESEKAQELGLKIVGHLRDMTDKFTKDTHMNWSTFATPAENFAGVALRACKKEFGVIPEITDRDYFTNSFHVPVYYKIRAFEKIAIEAPYHALCNAGAISYIELDGDPSKNVKAFMRIVRGMVDADMGYVAINHPVDRDPVCGYTGIIENECPHCHRKEKELVEYSFTTHRVKKGEKQNA